MNMDISGNSGNNTALSNLFNKSNFILVFWVLAIYIVASFLIGIFRKRDQDTSTMIRFVDILVFVIILALIVYYFFSYSDADKQNLMNQISTWLQGFLSNGTSIFSVLFFIFVFYTIVYITQTPMGANNKPVFVSFIESISWGFFFILLIVDIFYYLFKISLVDLIFNQGILSNIWKSLPNQPTDVSYSSISVPVSKDVSNNILPLKDMSGNKAIAGNRDISGNKEVFNVGNNYYTYDDAEQVCATYGATLATYDQIEAAYNDGAEWCNYGWSANQMAFFPTQKKTWSALQDKPEHRNDCGRPGINGGYFANPKLKFGVNCYGIKPNPTGADLSRMQIRNTQVSHPTQDDQAQKEKIAFWQKNADKYLQLNSFNKNSWSEY